MSNNIDLYIQELEDSKVEIKRAIIAKGVTPTGGLSSYADAVKMIPTGGNSKMLPLSKTITENGEYEYNPINDGVDGYSRVSMNVDIPIPTFETQSKEVTIKKNGTVSIVPDSGYDGLSEVNVTVQVSTGGSDKPQIMNGFRFTGGDIAQVDFSQYDWSMVYDTSEFFRNCPHSTGDWSNFLENFNGDILSLKHMFGGTQTTQRDGVQSLPNLGNKTSGIISTAYMCNLNPSLIDVSSLPQWDTSKVTDASYMFGSDQSSAMYNPKITSVDLTNFGSPDGYKAEYMFAGCRSLESITGPLHPVGSVLRMFAYCQKLTSISQLDTSNVTNMSYMFQGCSSLTSIPQLDTSNVTDMRYMFSACSQLTSFPEIDTSNVTYALNMFQNCYALTSIPQLDFRSWTGSVSLLCPSCTSLVEVGNINFENATYLSGIFKSCSNLTSIGDVICPNNKMFFGSYGSDCWVYQCTKLQKIGVIDCDSVTNLQYFFYGGDFLNLTEFGGCRNLGKASSVSNTNGSDFMVKVPNLTYESVMNVINGLYDRASAGLSVLTLKLHANHLAMLSADDIAIATNKGWTIV